MEETKAIAGILIIMAISITAYFVLTSGTSGAVVQYQSCCCNMLITEPAQGIQQILSRGQLGASGPQTLVRSQIQTYANNCNEACKNYEAYGKVFAQQGLCADNP